MALLLSLSTMSEPRFRHLLIKPVTFISYWLVWWTSIQELLQFLRWRVGVPIQMIVKTQYECWSNDLQKKLMCLKTYHIRKMTTNTKHSDLLVTHIPLHTYMQTYKHIFKRLSSEFYLCSIVFIIVPYDSKTIDSL